MIAASKLASLGLAAKVGLGVTVVSASAAGAGAAGVLPDQVNERARTAIEAVTPVDFEDPATEDHEENFGSVVSSDATGESDGQPGVDGSEISDMAPGAEHRPSDAGQAPVEGGAPDVTGLDQATDAPGAPDLPDDAGAPAVTPTTPDAPPVTVPSGGRPDTAGSATP